MKKPKNPNPKILPGGSKTSRPNPIPEEDQTKSKSEPCCKAVLKTKDPTAARFKLRLYENQMTSVPCEKDNTDKTKSIEVIQAPAQNGGLFFG